MSADPENEFAPPPPLSEEAQQRGLAFMAATAVSVMLFVVTVLAWLFHSGDPAPEAAHLDWQQTIFALLILTGLIVLAAIIPAVLMMSLLVLPVYRFLKRRHLLTARWILASSYLIGVIGGYVCIVAMLFSGRLSRFGFWPSPDATLQILTEAIVPASVLGLCTLAGGLVFCRMTIWRKPESDGGSNV
ncbi:MAG: hypothetical protein ACLFV8_11050 [Alphaproteobacteria bacterium]